VLVDHSNLAMVVEALKRYYGASLSHDSREEPFRALMGCILSQRTKDANASRAVEALFGEADTPQEVLALDEATLKQLIRPSGFYNTKASYIFAACTAIRDRFGGAVPKSREELLSIPGVGPKTADIVLSYGYGEPAIAVDTHILRVSRRLGVVGPYGTPEEAKAALEGAMPTGDYRFVDSALLQLGKDFCKQRKPECEKCPLAGQCKGCLS